MNILSISSILPIPGVIKNNDFVFQTYINYRTLFEKDKVLIIKPARYKWNPFIHLGRRQKRNDYKRINHLVIHGFQVEIFPFFSTWRLRNIHAIITRSVYFLNRKRIKRLLSSHNIEIIHAQFIFPDGMLAYIINKRYRIPYVLTTHNEKFYFDHRISKCVGHKILKNASKVIPINHQNYQYFKSFELPDMEMVPLGFNKAFLRKQRSVSSERVRILTIAELIKLKNIDKVLYAIKELVPRHDLLYTIIGEGPERDRLEKLVQFLHLNEYVQFIRSVPHEEIAEEMYTHDIFIMPSFFETFGRVYFEVMAMGIPIICARNSGIFGIFKEYEEGISVNHNRIKEIVQVLDGLISNPDNRQRIGRNGKRLIENYTWENIARKLHLIYAIAIDTVANNQNV